MVPGVEGGEPSFSFSVRLPRCLVSKTVLDSQASLGHLRHLQVDFNTYMAFKSTGGTVTGASQPTQDGVHVLKAPTRGITLPLFVSAFGPQGQEIAQRAQPARDLASLRAANEGPLRISSNNKLRKFFLEAMRGLCTACRHSVPFQLAHATARHTLLRDFGNKTILMELLGCERSMYAILLILLRSNDNGAIDFSDQLSNCALASLRQEDQLQLSPPLRQDNLGRRIILNALVVDEFVGDVSASLLCVNRR